MPPGDGEEGRQSAPSAPMRPAGKLLSQSRSPLMSTCPLPGQHRKSPSKQDVSARNAPRAVVRRREYRAGSGGLANPEKAGVRGRATAIWSPTGRVCPNNPHPRMRALHRRQTRPPACHEHPSRPLPNELPPPRTSNRLDSSATNYAVCTWPLRNKSNSVGKAGEARTLRSRRRTLARLRREAPSASRMQTGRP